MKSKKNVNLILIFLILLAIFMNNEVNAGEYISGNIIIDYSLKEIASTSEEVDDCIDMTEYINNKKNEFQSVIGVTAAEHLDYNSLFSTEKGNYKYIKTRAINSDENSEGAYTRNVSPRMIDGTLYTCYAVTFNYTLVTVTKSCEITEKAYTALSSDGITIAKNDTKALNYNAVFNPEDYWEMNPDVKADAYFGSSYDNAFIHFLNYGMPEGRVGSYNFNVVKYAYCLLNDDLRRAFGGNMKQYYIHFLRYGQFEGRSKSDWDSIFDADFYLTANPDVKTYLINKYTSDGNLKGWCLWHYCEFGANEGRLANSEFSVLNYASANPDIFRAYSQYTKTKIITDFKAIAVQYLQFGKRENRRIVNGKYNMNNLPTLRPDVVSVLGISNLSGWVDWYINCGSKGM